MIYPDTDPKLFALKHGIQLKQHPCHKCGILVDVNIPMISKEYVGFESKPHEPCGPQYKISSFKHRDPNWMENFELSDLGDLDYDDSDDLADEDC